MAGPGRQGAIPIAPRFVTFTHAVAFVLGFSAVFITLGAAVTAVGQLLYDLRSWLALIGRCPAVRPSLRNEPLPGRIRFMVR